MYLMDEWSDVRFGPLQNLWGERVLPPSPPWWCYTCELSRTPIGDVFSTVLGIVSGISLDQHIAFNRVCGESLERYCGLTYQPEDAVEISIQDNPFVFKMPRCSIFENPPASFTSQWLETHPTHRVTHVPARSFLDEQSIWVPYSLVTLDSLLDNFLLSEITSTGLAFGRTLVDALWSGLCEVIERDNAIISWLCRSPAKRLVQLEYQPRLSRYLEHLSRRDIVPYLFDVSLDISIPTVICLLRSEQYPYWTVGTSCHSDPIQACLKAIDEAVSVRIMLDREPTPNRRLECEPLNALERAIIYGQEPSFEPFRYLFDSPLSPIELWSRQAWIDDLSVLVQTLAHDLGYTPVWKDLTTEDVVSTGYVIRAIVPELVPLSQEFRWLEAPRLQKFHTGDWNLSPHPFA